MKVNQLIAALQAIVAKHGEGIEVVGGFMGDDRPPTKAIVVDVEGMEVKGSVPSERIAGVFFE